MEASSTSSKPSYDGLSLPLPDVVWLLSQEDAVGGSVQMLSHSAQLSTAATVLTRCRVSSTVAMPLWVRTPDSLTTKVRPPNNQINKSLGLSMPSRSF